MSVRSRTGQSQTSPPVSETALCVSSRRLVRHSTLALAFVVLPDISSAADVAGIRLEERTTLGTSELILNGSGLRKRAFFKFYVAGLYLAEKRTTSADVLALPGPKRVSIILLRDLPVGRLVDALNNGIRDNSSPEEQQATRSRVEALGKSLLALGHAREGDVITFDWVPEFGTRVAVNGEVKGSAIPGDDAYCALLKVWLGERPTNARLKKALLGRSE